MGWWSVFLPMICSERYGSLSGKPRSKGYFEARKLPLVVKEVKGKKAFHFEGTQVYTSSFMLPATLQDNAPYTLEAWVLNDSISEMNVWPILLPRMMNWRKSCWSTARSLVVE